MISKLTIENVQGIVQADLQLNGITAVFGDNGGGKTSLCDALHFAVTGQAARFDTLGELVRQGSSSGFVEIRTEAGASFMRTADRKGRGCWIEGVESKQPEFTAALDRAIGSPRAVGLALRAGALLELKPAELQSFLQELTGASFDAAAIAAELDASAKRALEHLSLAMPASLADLASVSVRAVEGRKRDKATRDARTADLARLPRFADDVSAEAYGQSHAATVLLIDAQRRERDQAVAARMQGGRDVLLQQLRDRRAQLATVPVVNDPDLNAAEAAHTQASRAEDRATDAVAIAERRLKDAQFAAEGEKDLPADANSLPELIIQADDRRQQLISKLATVKSDGEKQKRALDAARGLGGCCALCGQVIPAELVAALQEKYELAQGVWKETARGLNAADAEVNALSERIARLKAIRSRLAAVADVPALEQDHEAKRLVRVHAVRESQRANDAVDRARTQWTDWKASQAAQREIDAIDQQIASVDASPTVTAASVEELDAQLARLGLVLQAVDAQQERTRLQAEVRALELRIEAADAVDQACGAKGVRVQLLGRAVRPFLDAANAMLAQVAPGFAVDVEADGELGFLVRKPGATVRPRACSRGERTVVLASLQVAVATLSRAPMVVIDDVESLSPDRRDALKSWLGARAPKSMQFLLLTATPAPEGVKPGVVAYEMKDGRSRRIPELPARAA